jgi:hypothetical protein
VRFFISISIFIWTLPKSNAQIKIVEKQHKQIIEKYFWKGDCDKNGFERLTVEVYNDSTFIFRPLVCKEMYNSKRVLFKTKKEWKKSRFWAAYGDWKIINGKRKYFQNNHEIEIKQFNNYLTYKDSSKLSLIK